MLQFLLFSQFFSGAPACLISPARRTLQRSPPSRSCSRRSGRTAPRSALGVGRAWSHGRVVSAVLPGGPADREGTLQPGDVLLEASPLPLAPLRRSASSAAPARSSRGSGRGGGRRGGPAGGAARSGSRASTSASQRMTILGLDDITRVDARRGSPGAVDQPHPAARTRVVAQRPARRGVAPSSAARPATSRLNAFVSIADIHDGAWVPIFLFSSFEHGAVEITCSRARAHRCRSSAAISVKARSGASTMTPSRKSTPPPALSAAGWSLASARG